MLTGYSTNHFKTTKVSFTIFSGHKTVEVLLPTTNDNFVEKNDLVNVSLSLTSGCCVVASKASIQIEIIDDDGKYNLSY